MVYTPEQVVISGGSVAGLAAAEALRQRGIPSLVVERRPEVVVTGFAFNLPGNAVRALSLLGLGEEVSRTGTRLRRREYRSEKGRTLFAVDEERFWGADMAPRSIRRSALLRMLGRRLPDDGIVRGREVQSVSSSNGQVEVGLDDGTTLHPRLLIAAEGVESRARAMIGGGEGTVSDALIAPASWRFVVPNPGVECWTVWVGKRTTILLMPLDGDEAYGWVSSPGSGQISELPDRFRGFPEPVRRALEAAAARPEAVVHSPIREVRAPRWFRDGVVLVGDAAHATAPVWAQGAAMAMEDALVLAERLAAQPDRERALAEFEARRRPRVAHVQTVTDRMSRSAKLAPWIRNALMPLVGPGSYRAAYGMLKEQF
ncbi:MAG: FAD-dependent monooxygenase [Janthinobacterium lividum]